MTDHTDLTKSVLNTPRHVIDAAKAIHAAGGSPRAQLDAGRVAAGHKKIVYTPHIGAKQRAKALKATK